MLDMFKKSMLTGIGLALKTWDEVEALGKELEEKATGCVMRMDDTIQKMVAEAGRERLRPDGTPYRSLSFQDQRDLVERYGAEHKQIQLAALKQGTVPEVYARNQQTLSNEDQVKLLQSSVAVIGLGGLVAFILLATWFFRVTRGRDSE